MSPLTVLLRSRTMSSSSMESGTVQMADAVPRYDWNSTNYRHEELLVRRIIKPQTTYSVHSSMGHCRLNH